MFLGKSLICRSDSFAWATPVGVDFRVVSSAYQSRKGAHTIGDYNTVGGERLAKLSR
jgi:hypothetical protein